MQRFYAFLVFGLAFCASAFSQDRGTIQCDPGSMTLVPAWIAPGRPHVVEHLNCGQMVSVVDVGSFLSASQYSSRPPEYVKILIGEKEAYVDARYVKLLGSKEPLKVSKAGQPPARQNLQEEEEQKKMAADRQGEHFDPRSGVPRSDLYLRAEDVQGDGQQRQRLSDDSPPPAAEDL